MSGLPDIIVCAEGVFVGLETKMPSKRNNRSARQILVASQIGNAQGTAQVCCSPAEAVRIVQQAIYDIKGA